MDSKTEIVSCDLCGSDRSSVLFSGSDRLLGLPGVFRFVRCLDCGLVRQNPRLTSSALETYYPESYPSYALAVQAQKGLLRRIDYRYGQLRRVRLVGRYVRQGRLLDVGCGTGEFVYEVGCAAGWRSWGLEPNDYACDYAHNVLGVDVIRGTLSLAPLAANAFDVVTLWNVLEHVSDPRRNLEQAHRVLRPGGYLVFSVPVVHSRLQEWFGSYWVEWDLPRHLYVFTPKVVQQYLGETGFELVAVESVSSEYRAFRMSVQNWVNEHFASETLRKAVQGFLRFVLVRVVGVIALRVVIPTRRQSVLVFVARGV